MAHIPIFSFLTLCAGLDGDGDRYFIPYTIGPTHLFSFVASFIFPGLQQILNNEGLAESDVQKRCQPSRSSYFFAFSSLFRFLVLSNAIKRGVTLRNTEYNGTNKPVPIGISVVPLVFFVFLTFFGMKEREEALCFRKVDVS